MKFNRSLDWLKESDEDDNLLADDELDAVEEEMNEGLYVDPSNYDKHNDLVDVVDKAGNPQKMTQATYDKNKDSGEFEKKEPEEKDDDSKEASSDAQQQSFKELKNPRLSSEFATGEALTKLKNKINRQKADKEKQVQTFKNAMTDQPKDWTDKDWARFYDAYGKQILRNEYDPDSSFFMPKYEKDLSETDFIKKFLRAGKSSNFKSNNLINTSQFLELLPSNNLKDRLGVAMRLLTNPELPVSNIFDKNSSTFNKNLYNALEKVVDNILSYDKRRDAYDHVNLGLGTFNPKGSIEALEKILQLTDNEKRSALYGDHFIDILYDKAKKLKNATAQTSTSQTSNKSDEDIQAIASEHMRKSKFVDGVESSRKMLKLYKEYLKDYNSVKSKAEDLQRRIDNYSRIRELPMYKGHPKKLKQLEKEFEEYEKSLHNCKRYLDDHYEPIKRTKEALDRITDETVQAFTKELSDLSSIDTYKVLHTMFDKVLFDDERETLEPILIQAFSKATNNDAFTDNYFKFFNDKEAEKIKKTLDI